MATRRPTPGGTSTGLVEHVLEEEMDEIRGARGDAFASGRWDDARALFTEMALADEYPDLLTVPAYERML
jgi:malate synthase